MGEKRTPTPWETCERGDYFDDGIVILGDDMRIAVVNREEDATFIVRAVNSHDKLIEALEIIAGKRPCLDNLMGNADIALAALSRHGEGK